MDTYLKRYLWVVQLILIMIVGHSMSMLMNHFLVREIGTAISKATPQDNRDSLKPPKVKRAAVRSWANTIAERNLFNANPPSPEELRAAQKKDAAEIVPEGKAPGPDDPCEPSKISATLRMTMIVEPKDYSYCIIQVQQKDRIFVINDEIEEHKVVDIQWIGEEKRVVLKEKDRNIYSCLVTGKEQKRKGIKRKPPPSKRNRKRKPNKNQAYAKGIKETSPGQFQIDRAMLNEQLEDMDSLLQQARVIPHYKRGKPVGFKVIGVRNNSIFKHLGLRSGDVLTSVGGEELNSVTKALSLFDRLKTSDNVSLGFDRRGAKTTYEYNIQ